MKKIILWSATLLVLLLLAVLVVASTLWALRPQVITLKDGTKLTLVGVTYGKHHVFKGIRTSGSMRHGRATLDTTNDAVVVWIESQRKGENRFGNNFQLFVYDTANTACVGTRQSTSRQAKAGTDILAFTLDAFPRRDGKMILRVASLGNGGGMRVAKGEFVAPNPGPRSFTEWQPEPMPDMQSDGDLDVTLTKCVVGAKGIFFNGGGDTSSKDPMHQSVQVAFHTEQNGTVATNWQPVSVETSDATGNQATMHSWSNYQRDTNNDSMMTYQWGLWPSEPAWKLRVEMSRTSGFTEAETLAVTNVPIHKGSWQDLWNYQGRRFGNEQENDQTNSAFAEGTINGYHISVFPVIQITDQNWGQGHPGGLRVMVDPDIPTGYRLTVLATNERGRHLQSWGPYGGGNGYVAQFQDLGSGKLLNLTIAIHKSRFVEFTVKPTTR